MAERRNSDDGVSQYPEWKRHLPRAEKTFIGLKRHFLLLKFIYTIQAGLSFHGE